MSHIRAEIILDKTTDVAEFVRLVNKEADHFIIENEDCSLSVDAKSYLGVFYASADFKSPLYLVNKDHDGQFPMFVDNYRCMNNNL